MHLKAYTDYALRVLVFVGVKAEEWSTISEIAKSYGISKNHLRKVVHQLSQHGFIETAQGRHGGIRLGRPADQIGVGEVVRAMEDGMVLVECFNPAGSQCRIAPACVLRSVLHDALGAFMRALDGHRLSDLIGARHALADLLNIGKPRGEAAASGSATATRRMPEADHVRRPAKPPRGDG